MEAQMYLPAYMREVAQSGNLNHNQHANYVELLADFAEKRDKEFYALRAEVERLHEQLRLATVDQAIAEAEASDAHAENKRLQESLAALEQEAGRG